MVTTRPPISKSSSSFNNPLVIVPKASNTIGIIVTFMFHNFFNSLERSKYFFLFSFSFSFYSVVNRDSKVNNFASTLFLVDYYKLWSRLGEPFVCQSSIGVYVDRYRVMHIPFVRMVEFKFLADLPRITFPTQSWFGLVVWVLWHINLCGSFNAKFCLYIHTYSTKDFKTNIKVGKIFYLQDFICLHKINQF